MINRAFANVLSESLPESRDFYVQLLGFTVAFDSDWFVNLQDPENPGNELGIWRRDHELIPQAYRAAPQGTILTFVVDDVDAVHATAVTNGVEVIKPVRQLFYGQRSMLVRDPDGQLVDVSSPGTPSPEFVAELERSGQL